MLSFAIYTVLVLSVRAANIDPSVAVKSLVDSNVAASANVSLACLIEHCATESIECFLSIAGCDKVILCAERCFKEWEHDYIQLQNCSNICADSAYGNKAYYDFMVCLSDHNCISFPPIPSTCRAPNVHPLKNLTTKALDGAWWVTKGYHPVYDCYPCQHLHLAPVNASFYSYVATYDTYTLDDKLMQVSLHAGMPISSPGGNISFSYHDGSGLLHHETWWLIDSADDGSYVPMYYCGHALDWNYEGALVLARNRTLSDADYVKIANSYEKAVGLKLNDFCNPTTLKCTDN